MTARTLPRPAFRERELSRLWESQALPPEALVTADGSEVQVIYRGRRGTGAGPDFRDAVLRFGPPAGPVVRGDIELHVRASDFYRHGHHTDRAYSRLALHVVFIDGGVRTSVLEGPGVPTVALSAWVERRAGELRAALSDPRRFREPCHTAIERLGAIRVTEKLDQWGRDRLRDKATLITADGNNTDAGLYLVLARALGLTRNTTPMERLARLLPLIELRALARQSADPSVMVEGVLLGAAGLLSYDQFTLWPDSLNRTVRLVSAWQAAGAPHDPSIIWANGPSRPHAGTSDRIAGLAALVLRDGPPLDASLADWRALLMSGASRFLEALTVVGYVGKDRALELAVNAVLPWLLAAYPNDATLNDAVYSLYADLPGPASYGSTRLLNGALRDVEGRSLVRGAAATQGALALHREWCTQGGCGRCPLS